MSDWNCRGDGLRRWLTPRLTSAWQLLHDSRPKWRSDATTGCGAVRQDGPRPIESHPEPRHEIWCDADEPGVGRAVGRSRLPSDRPLVPGGSNGPTRPTLYHLFQHLPHCPRHVGLQSGGNHRYILGEKGTAKTFHPEHVSGPHLLSVSSCQRDIARDKLNRPHIRCTQERGGQAGSGSSMPSHAQSRSAGVPLPVGRDVPLPG